MRGPSLFIPTTWPDESDLETPSEMISSFATEILAGLDDDTFERLEIDGSLEPLRLEAEVVALCLARSWHFKSPWWADEALRLLHTKNLPTTKATENAHIFAADLRISGDGQSLKKFQRQHWEDLTYFQVSAMRMAGISAKEASQHGARWRDEFSDGNATVKASKIDKGYPKWASDPLRGKVWVGQLSRVMSKLNDAEKIKLIRKNKSRAAKLPPLPEGLKGERR